MPEGALTLADILFPMAKEGKKYDSAPLDFFSEEIRRKRLLDASRHKTRDKVEKEFALDALIYRDIARKTGM